MIHGAPEIVHLPLIFTNTSSRCQRQLRRRPASFVHALLLISAANIGPNRFHQKPHALMADIDPTLEQKIFDLPQRQRIADVQHHHEADHLG